MNGGNKLEENKNLFGDRENEQNVEPIKDETLASNVENTSDTSDSPAKDNSETYTEDFGAAKQTPELTLNPDPFAGIGGNAETLNINSDLGNNTQPTPNMDSIFSSYQTPENTQTTGYQAQDNSNSAYGAPQQQQNGSPYGQPQQAQQPYGGQSPYTNQQQSYGSQNTQQQPQNNGQYGAPQQNQSPYSQPGQNQQPYGGQSPYASNPSPYGGQYPYNMPKQPNGIGVASLVVGIIALLSLCTGQAVFTIIVSIIAIVCGVNSRKKVGSNGMATAGIVLGIISLVFGIIGLVIITALRASGISDMFWDEFYNEFYKYY